MKTRDRIVRLSKELAECEDEKLRRKLRSHIQALKEQLPQTEPKKIGKLF